MPVFERQPRAARVRAAFRAARLRSAALRFFALLFACRERAICDAACVPSRLSAARTAFDLVGDGLVLFAF